MTSTKKLSKKIKIVNNLKYLNIALHLAKYKIKGLAKELGNINLEREELNNTLILLQLKSKALVKTLSKANSKMKELNVDLINTLVNT